MLNRLLLLGTLTCLFTLAASAGSLTDGAVGFSTDIPPADYSHFGGTEPDSISASFAQSGGGEAEVFLPAPTFDPFPNESEIPGEIPEPATITLTLGALSLFALRRARRRA